MSRRVLALLVGLLCLLTGPGPRAASPKPRRAVASYVLRAKVTPATRTLDGTLGVVWRNASASPVDEILFRLPLNRGGERTTIRSVTREDGSALEQQRRGADAVVRLPAPVAPGETTAMHLRFETRFTPLRFGAGWWGEGEGQRYLSGLGSFPVVAALRTDEQGATGWRARNDYADYRVTLTIPKVFVAAASGRRTAAPIDNGDGTLGFSWTARSQLEFAFVLTDALRLREERLNASGPRLRVLFPPDHVGVAERLVQAARTLVTGDAERFGPFPDESLAIVDLPAGCAGLGEFSVRGLVALSTDRTAPEQTRQVEWSLLRALRLRDRDRLHARWILEDAARRSGERAWGPPRPGRHYGAIATRYFDPRVHWIQDPDGIWLYFASQPGLHLDRDVAVRRPGPDPVAAVRLLVGEKAFDAASRATLDGELGDWTAALAAAAPDAGVVEGLELWPKGAPDAALVRAAQRPVAAGRWEWTIEVRYGAGFPPIEVWAKSRAGASELLALCDSDRVLTVERDAPLAEAWLGPAWLERIDRDPGDNARLVEGKTDGRAALVLAWRALLAFEEQLRAYVGVIR